MKRKKTASEGFSKAIKIAKKERERERERERLIDSNRININTRLVIDDI